MDRLEHQNDEKRLYNSPLASKAQGAIGEKITVIGVVLYQFSREVDTPRGRVYSHDHLIIDHEGNQYHYRGSSFFPVNNHVAFKATVKGYSRGKVPSEVITVIKAPKPL